MSLVVIHGNDRKYADLLDKAFVLRHRSFIEELKWQALKSVDGRERDQFDHDEAIHFLEMERGEIAIYSRLIPTTRPHLLSDVYPQLASREIPRGPAIMEWTRFTVAERFRGDGRWSFAGGSMVRSIARYCLDHDIDTLSLQGHPVWISRFLILGFSPVPLGLPQPIEGKPVVAMKFAVTDEVYDALCAAGGQGLSALSTT